MLTRAARSSIFASSGEGARSSVGLTRKPGVRLASRRIVPLRSRSAVSLKHRNFFPPGLSVRGRSAKIKGSSDVCRRESGIHGQTAEGTRRPAASLCRSDGANTEPHRQPGCSSMVATRGPWLSADRQPPKCSWNIALTACSRISSGRFTNYSFPSDGVRLGTHHQR